MNSTLSPDNPLFRHLATKPPLWWQNLIKDKDIYCDVLKDNTLNVYCNGGSIMRLEWNGRYKAEIHHEYIPLKGGRPYLPFGFDPAGNISMTSPGIIDLNNFAPATLEKIKKRIRKFHPNKSEKGLQGNYVARTLASKWRHGFFIDTEMQYEGRRIDLVWVSLKHKMIAFVELKTSADYRLLMETGPESRAIDGQLKKYADLIHSHREGLLDYYDRVYRIKKKLGLLKNFSKHRSLANFTLLEKPILLVGDCSQAWIDQNASSVNNRVSRYAHGCVYQGASTFNFRIPMKTRGNSYCFDG